MNEQFCSVKYTYFFILLTKAVANINLTNKKTFILIKVVDYQIELDKLKVTEFQILIMHISFIYEFSNMSTVLAVPYRMMLNLYRQLICTVIRSSIKAIHTDYSI